MPRRKERFWLIANTLALVGTLGINGAANALPIGGQTTGEVSAAYPNLFTPASVTFSIWGLIYLALAGFLIHQWRKLMGQGKAEATETLGATFVLSCVFNGVWLIAWHYGQIALSLLFMIGLLVSLVLIYTRLQNMRKRNVTPQDRWLVYAPFGLYIGWISVATIANVSAFLVSIGFRGGPFSELAWTLVMIGIAFLLGSTFLLIRRDPFPTLVFFWAFTGIALRHGYSSVLGLVALAAALLLLVGTGAQLIRGRLY